MHTWTLPVHSSYLCTHKYISGDSPHALHSEQLVPKVRCVQIKPSGRPGPVSACRCSAVYLQGQLCVLAEDCDQPDYKKLVEALCSEHNVSLLSVPEAKQLGQWAGVSPLGLAPHM